MKAAIVCQDVVRRIPSEREKVPSFYNLEEPDLETCRRFGQQNIKEIKKMRAAKAEGKDIFKIVRLIV
jgi:hypothetical protein